MCLLMLNYRSLFIQMCLNIDYHELTCYSYIDQKLHGSGLTTCRWAIKKNDPRKILLLIHQSTWSIFPHIYMNPVSVLQ